MTNAERLKKAREMAPQGYVVVKVPDNAPLISVGRDEHTVEYAEGHDDGWHYCRDTIIASSEADYVE